MSAHDVVRKNDAKCKNALPLARVDGKLKREVADNYARAVPFREIQGGNWKTEVG
jgi:hypothetical protein